MVEIISMIIAILAFIVSIYIVISEKIYKRRLYSFIKKLSSYSGEYKTIHQISNDLSISESTVSEYLLDLLHHDIVQIYPGSSFKKYKEYEWRLNFLHQDM